MRSAIYVLMLISAFAIAACGGGAAGGGGGSSAPGSASSDTETAAFVAARTSPISSGDADCPYGGIFVETGVDGNKNSALEPDEVDSRQKVCNGAEGPAGLSTLVSVANEPTGANCVNGGKKVSVGNDNNRNNILDSGEIASSDYICNGAAGQAGAAGSNGANGLNSLMAIASEPAGAHCSNGGQKTESGLDMDADNILDAGEVTSTTYICNGATGPAGPGVTWVEITGTSQQAVSNTGYMANNPLAVTITLPSAPAVGDIVRVSGIGSGGWKIAQNAGQSIIAKNPKDSTGAVWIPRQSNMQWTSIASSSDGTKLVAAAYGGQIYTSADSGAAWTARDSNRNWVSVASSADGTRLIAAVYDGQLYTSPDSGITWTPRESNRKWWAVASSSDGTMLVAAVRAGGQLYTSADSGVTWMPRESNRNWWAVASSSDGTRLTAVENGGKLYTSADSGISWTAHESNRYWLSVASSSDGARLIAAANGGQLYTSPDSGASWAPRESNRNWSAAASSSDGTMLAAAEYGGQVYTSVPTAIQSTTAGPAGFMSGGQYDAVELQYIGNNTFIALSHEGNLILQ